MGKGLLDVSLKLCLSAILLLSSTSALLAQDLPVTTSSEKARSIFNKGMSYLESGRGLEAIAAFEGATKVDSTFSFAYAMWALNQHLDAKSGIDQAEKAMQYSKDASIGEKKFAEAVQAHTSQNFEETIAIAKELRSTYPDSWLPELVLADIYFILDRDLEKAEKVLQQALEEHPEHNIFLNLLGYVLRGQERYEEAEQVFKKNIQLHPNEPNPYDSIANLYTRIGAFDKAVTYFKKSIDVDPDFKLSGMFPSRRAKLGYSLMQLEQYDRAEEVFKENLQRRPESAKSYHHLGELYFATGDYEKAKEQFKQALNIDPDFEASQKKLEQAQNKSG